MNGLRKSIIATIIMLGIFLTSSVKGATLTDSEYARLKLVYSDLRIATMSDEDASRYLSYDLENTKKVSKYYRVTNKWNYNNRSQRRRSNECNKEHSNTRRFIYNNL